MRLINLSQLTHDATCVDEKTITYYIEFPPSGKKIGLNLLDDEDFTIPYIPDTIPNSPDFLNVMVNYHYHVLTRVITR